MEEMNFWRYLPRSSSTKEKLPMGVKNWVWFKRWILEDDQKRAIFTPSTPTLLSKQEFVGLLEKEISIENWPTVVQQQSGAKTYFLADLYEWYRWTLDLTLPYIVQRSKYGGLGLIARQDNFPAKSIWGVLFFVSERIQEALLKRHYPSLYQFTIPKEKDNNNTQTTYAILCGPLALVNHHCQAHAGIVPLKKPLPELEDWANAGYQLVAVRYDLPDMKPGVGEEIVITYAPKPQLVGWFKCSC